jgi:hypothetical protein
MYNPDEMTQMTDPAGQVSVADVVSPLTSKMLFWRARYAQRSETLYHLPFLFWLVEAMRPARAVVLGVGDGVAHFALCQAVDKLNLSTQCHGIDQWPSPTPTKAVVEPKRAPSSASLPQSDQVPTILEVHNATHYAAFSVIEALDPRLLLARLAPGSVDLLCVDLEMTPTLVDALTYAWPTKLSASGVLLLLNADRQCAAPAAQEFLAQIRHTRQTISFATGAGLVVVLWGQDQPYRLTRLAGLERKPLGAGGDAGDVIADGLADDAGDGLGTMEIKQIFTRLGLLHRLEWEAPHEALQHQNVAQALGVAQTDLQTTLVSLGDLQKAYELRSGKTAVFQSRVHDLEHAKAVAEAAAQASLEQWQADHARLSADLTEIRQDLAQREAGWRAELQASAAELALREAELQAEQQIGAAHRAAQEAELQAVLQAEAARWAAHEVAQQAQSEAADGHLQDIMVLTAALSRVQAEKHALIEQARPKPAKPKPALSDFTPSDSATTDLAQMPGTTAAAAFASLSGSSTSRTGPRLQRRKNGLWAKIKASALMAPIRRLRQLLRDRKKAASSRSNRSGRVASAGPVSLLTQVKRARVMAPVRAVVRQVRRRRQEARMRAAVRALESRIAGSDDQ